MILLDNNTFKMVASYLLLVNHLLAGLTYNSPSASAGGVRRHPNDIIGTNMHLSNDKRRYPYSADDKQVVNRNYVTSVDHNDFENPESNSIGEGVSCGYGCSQCSAVNGCLSCRRPFFLTLHRTGARQIALCQRSCPEGYYKTRYSKKRFCAICEQSGCRWCSSHSQCSVCQIGYTRRGGNCSKDEHGGDGLETSMPSSDPRSRQEHQLVMAPIVLPSSRHKEQSNDINRNKRKRNQYHHQQQQQQRILRRRNRLKSRDEEKINQRRLRIARRRKRNRARNYFRVPANSNSSHLTFEVIPSSYRLQQSKIRRFRVSKRRKNIKKIKKKRKQLDVLRPELNILDNEIPLNDIVESGIKPDMKYHSRFVSRRLLQPRVTLVRPSRHTRRRPRRTRRYRFANNMRNRTNHVNKNKYNKILETIENNNNINNNTLVHKTLRSYKQEDRRLNNCTVIIRNTSITTRIRHKLGNRTQNNCTVNQNIRNTNPRNRQQLRNSSRSITRRKSRRRIRKNKISDSRMFII